MDKKIIRLNYDSHAVAIVNTHALYNIRRINAI